MKLNNEKEIRSAYSKKFRDDENDVAHLKQMLSYRILGEVERITDERNILRNELAKLLDVSPSYITQLYRGSKVVNLDLLAKIEKKLEFRFDIKAVAPEILEINNTACEHSWNEEQILSLVDKFKSSKGSWIYINNLWGEKSDTPNRKEYKIEKNTHQKPTAIVV